MQNVSLVITDRKLTVIAGSGLVCHDLITSSNLLACLSNLDAFRTQIQYLYLLIVTLPSFVYRFLFAYVVSTCVYWLKNSRALLGNFELQENKIRYHSLISLTNRQGQFGSLSHRDFSFLCLIISLLKILYTQLIIMCHWCVQPRKVQAVTLGSDSALMLIFTTLCTKLDYLRAFSVIRVMQCRS